MKLIYVLLISLIGLDVYAGAGTFPQGDHVKLLKDLMEFKTGITIGKSTVDPSVTSTPGDEGSILTSTFGVFYKTDAGTSTNWNKLVSPAAGTEGQFLAYDVATKSYIPTDTLQGSLNPVTDWISFTPTGSWTTNTTYIGYKKQIGDEMFYEVRVAVSGGAPVGGTLTINIPDGGVIDATKTSAEPSDNANLGQVTVLDAGTGRFRGGVDYNDSTSVRVSVFNNSGVYEDHAPVTLTVPMIFTTNDEVHIKFHVPIVGLTSGVDAVAQNKTLVSVVAKDSDLTAFTALVTDINFTETYDPQNAWTGNNTFTASRDMVVNVSGATRWSTGATQVLLYAYIDGVQEKNISFNKVGTTSMTLHHFSGQVKLLAGEQLTLRQDNSGTWTGVASNHHLVITELPSDLVIAAAIDSQKQTCTTKYLTADLTADTNPVNDLTFTMVAGKKYSLSYQSSIAIALVGSRSRFLLNALDGTIDLARSLVNTESTTFTNRFAFSSVNNCFTADGTSLTFNLFGLLGTPTLEGNSTKEETFAQLCELPDNYICN